jgi:large subunit ribosomal protein L40e
MATAEVVPKSSSTFVYEDLISHVQNIRNQIVKFDNILNNRCKNDKYILNVLKSRSLTFIDPYGNVMNVNSIDHEIINNVIKKFKNDYVPKYLQKWIKIGTMNENLISPLNDFELKSTVSNYATDYRFISYVDVTVWIGGYEYTSPRPFILRVLLLDNMEKITSKIAQLGEFDRIQLFFLTVNENAKPDKNNWNECTILKSEDTILSCELYKDNRIILAKFGEHEPFHIFLKTETKTTFLWSSPWMNVFDMKQRIQNKEGISANSQSLVYNGRYLDDRHNLATYNIPTESMIYVVEPLRGGMYHFTSGRQDFRRITYDGAKAVRKVLQFKIKSTTRARHSSPAKLQEYILKSQNILLNLYQKIEDLYVDEGIPHLKNIILQIDNDN